MKSREIIIEEINKYTENKFNFNLKSATLDEGADFCVVEIYYKDGTLLNQDLKSKLCAIMLEFLPKKFHYEFNFIKNFVDDERIFNGITEFLQKNYPSLAFKVGEIKINGFEIECEILIDKLSFDYARSKNIGSVIQKEFEQNFDDYKIKIKLTNGEIETIDLDKELIENYKEEEIDESKFRIIELSNIVPIVSDKIVSPARYIVDQNSPAENVTICGKIKNIKKIIITRKPKQKDESENETLEEEQNVKNTEDSEGISAENEIDEEKLKQPKYERKLYKLLIEDITDSIICSYLSNKETQAKMENLCEGDMVALSGNIEKDSFTGDFVLKVNSIAYCSVPEDLKEFIVYKKEKPFYQFIKPEPMVIYEQNDLLSYAVEKQVPKFLQNKTFVCYDLETTGLHYERGDKMVEIGAIKIVDGKITEKFGTFVNPEGKKIDEKASETTGIYDNMVADAPKPEQVLQDFYKFTRGAIIIGYNNIRFDNQFLLGQAKACHFNFDNETDDVYIYAQKYIKGAKNYKLGTIADHLGVVLDNAHSAIYDALATAQVFLKIAEMME